MKCAIHFLCLLLFVSLRVYPTSFNDDFDYPKSVDINGVEYGFVNELDAGHHSVAGKYKAVDGGKEVAVLFNANPGGLKEYYDELENRDDITVPYPIGYKRGNRNEPDMLAMELMDGTVRSILSDLSEDEKYELAIQIRKKEEIFNDSQMSHADPHMNNVLYKRTNKGYDIKFVDFVGEKREAHESIYESFLYEAHLSDDDVKNHEKRKEEKRQRFLASYLGKISKKKDIPNLNIGPQMTYEKKPINTKDVPTDFRNPKSKPKRKNKVFIKQNPKYPKYSTIEINGIEHEFVSPIGSGRHSSAAIYKPISGEGDKVAVLFNPEGESLSDYHDELQKLSRSGITPKPIAYNRASQYGNDPDILVMELMDGNVHDLLMKEELSSRQKYEIAIQIEQKERQLKQAGIEHADPHMGNVLYSKEKKKNGEYYYHIKFIDFSGKPEQHNGISIYEHFLGVAELDPNEVDNYKKSLEPKKKRRYHHKTGSFNFRKQNKRKKNKNFSRLTKYGNKIEENIEPDLESRQIDPKFTRNFEKKNDFREGPDEYSGKLNNIYEKRKKHRNFAFSPVLMGNQDHGWANRYGPVNMKNQNKTHDRMPPINNQRQFLSPDISEINSLDVTFSSDQNMKKNKSRNNKKGMTQQYQSIDSRNDNHKLLTVENPDDFNSSYLKKSQNQQMLLTPIRSFQNTSLDIPVVKRSLDNKLRRDLSTYKEVKIPNLKKRLLSARKNFEHEKTKKSLKIYLNELKKQNKIDKEEYEIIYEKSISNAGQKLDLTTFIGAQELIKGFVNARLSNANKGLKRVAPGSNTRMAIGKNKIYRVPRAKGIYGKKGKNHGASRGLLLLIDFEENFE